MAVKVEHFMDSTDWASAGAVMAPNTAIAINIFLMSLSFSPEGGWLLCRDGNERWRNHAAEFGYRWREFLITLAHARSHVGDCGPWMRVFPPLTTSLI
jgi:hypothetical protein